MMEDEDENEMLDTNANTFGAASNLSNRNTINQGVAGVEDDDDDDGFDEVPGSVPQVPRLSHAEAGLLRSEIPLPSFQEPRSTAGHTVPVGMSF